MLAEAAPSFAGRILQAVAVLVLASLVTLGVGHALAMMSPTAVPAAIASAMMFMLILVTWYGVMRPHPLSALVAALLMHGMNCGVGAPDLFATVAIALAVGWFCGSLPPVALGTLLGTCVGYITTLGLQEAALRDGQSPYDGLLIVMLIVHAAVAGALWGVKVKYP